MSHPRLACDRTAMCVCISLYVCVCVCVCVHCSSDRVAHANRALDTLPTIGHWSAIHHTAYHTKPCRHTQPRSQPQLSQLQGTNRPAAAKLLRAAAGCRRSRACCQSQPQPVAAGRAVWGVAAGTATGQGPGNPCGLPCKEGPNNHRTNEGDWYSYQEE